MGIKGLNDVLRKYCPHVFKITDLSEFAYKKIAFDLTLFLCKFKTSYGDKWLGAFFDLVISLRQNQIHCVFIYDGVFPDEKNLEKADRIRSREKTEERTQALEQALSKYKRTNVADQILIDFNEKLNKDKGTETFLKIKPSSAPVANSEKNPMNIKLMEEKLKKMNNYNFRNTPEDFELTKELFEIMKVPFITSPMEAETMCSDLNKRNFVDAVASEDTDCLAYGAPCFLSKLKHYDSSCVQIDYNEVLDALSFTKEQFLDLCILLGCDYNKNIPKVVVRKRLN